MTREVSHQDPRPTQCCATSHPAPGTFPFWIFSSGPGWGGLNFGAQKAPLRALPLLSPAPNTGRAAERGGGFPACLQKPLPLGMIHFHFIPLQRVKARPLLPQSTPPPPPPPPRP